MTRGLALANRNQIEVEIKQTRDREDLIVELKLGEPMLGTVADAADGEGLAERAEVRA